MPVSNKVIKVDDLNLDEVNQVLNLLMNTLNLKLVKQTENTYGEYTSQTQFKIVPADQEVQPTQLWFDDERQP